MLQNTLSPRVIARNEAISALANHGPKAYGDRKAAFIYTQNKDSLLSLVEVASFLAMTKRFKQIRNRNFEIRNQNAIIQH